MREPPVNLSDATVLTLVQQHWDSTITHVEHLPIGFGAHHWRAEAAGTPRLFVTFDPLGRTHSAQSLETTYAAARDLAASGLEFVLAPKPSHAGASTIPVADGALSVTEWIEGDSGALRDAADAEQTATLLRRLHATRPSVGVVDWKPRVGRGFAAELAMRLGTPWETGPYGEHARAALSDAVGDIGRWVSAYHRLAQLAPERTWVPTHGEPDSGNQLLTPTGERLLVDWESLRRAPAERDLHSLVGDVDLPGIDWPMVEMFDLDRRLDEIATYAVWFSSPHTGTESDRVAWGGLRGELERDDWVIPPV